MICCGSSVYLKNTFGVGYNLSIVKEDMKKESTEIKNFISSHIKGSKVISDVSAEVGFQLPMD